MYTAQDLIKAITRECDIIIHLNEKINNEHHDHQFSSKQRTIRQLLQYLCVAPMIGTQAIAGEGDAAFQTMQEKMDAVDVNDFSIQMRMACTKVCSLIAGLSPEQLDEEVTLFGMLTNKRMTLFIEFVYAQIVAYKMQLFLQLKHAGREEISTSNLWMGRDSM